MAARLQESRAEAGVVAELRTETGTAQQAERPRGRHWLTACRLTLSEWDSSDGPATVEIKLGITLSPQGHSTVISSVTLNPVNLPGAETHWQDTLPLPLPIPSPLHLSLISLSFSVKMVF